MNKIFIFSLFALSIFFIGCKESNVPTLQEIMDEQSIPMTDELVACAASTIVTGIDFPPVHTMLYYKTIMDQSDIRVWHSEEFSQDFTKYEEISINDVRLHNNFMGSALINIQTGSLIVSTIADNTFYYSKPIEVLSENQNTQIHSDLIVDLTNDLQPTFSWPESTFDTESIYFQLIVDTNKDQAISGTYTYENIFSFYNLDNVVFNVTENENPTLEPNTEYMIRIMHVSDNNFVSKITSKTFVTP